MNKKLYLDIHVIQTVPPSCLNRDDTGSPKTAVYGGVRRARVSSQSWKKAVRDMFRMNLDEAEVGTRTKKIVDMVAEKIILLANMPYDESMVLAESIINAAGVTTKDKEARALFFMSDKQAENLAELALLEETPDKKTLQAALNQNTGIDIALFGRMVADDPNLNTDASAQVAHAISTHRVDNEFDYFTAVDDRSPEDHAGAGMIGTIEFNSATMYRYATVAVHELYNQLASDQEATARAVVEFVKAFITSMPTGKQNTFANRTPADAVLVCLRDDQPVNLVGAFEEAVRLKPDQSGYVRQSIDNLSEYHQTITSTFVEPPIMNWGLGSDFNSSTAPTDLLSLILSLDENIKSTYNDNSLSGD
ncbi:MAG: type I-E CRISPR-associated protein Cas7/Cse4/CasC [Coriobacteriia bacterium]|nr:type I-E CRISPR-associated protein Cas7/Cse4/CasC [Coriobacteriia bacterium]